MWTGVRPYVEIARPDHWFKNVFMLPGAVMAVLLLSVPFHWPQAVTLACGIVATSLVASANYVINELLDAPYDRHHPVKKARPVACGRVKVWMAFAEWLGLSAVALYLSYQLSSTFFLASVWLLSMGFVYNVPPLRTKDVPYLDVLSESVNNPIRLLLGWFAVAPDALPPLSAMFAYWMLGAFFMAAKRLAEWRRIADVDIVRSYRKSLAWYTADRLLVSMLFYACVFSFTFAVFAVRYRFELMLLFAPVGALLAEYLRLTFVPDSPVQYPEHLYRNRRLMAVCLLSTALFVLLLCVDIPLLEQLFSPGYIRLR